MSIRSCRLLNGFDQWGADKESVLDHPLIRKPNGQTQQRVDGGSVGRFRTENAYKVKLLDDSGGGLSVTAPHQGKLDL